MTKQSFKDLSLSKSVLLAVEEAGYITPTLVQAQVIPAITAGRDVFACAQTGTGKTASFTLPMVQILAEGRARARMPRSIVITPTRELAMQVSENFDIYSKHSNLKKALLIGGESVVEQERILARDVDVLIATPGRLHDLFGRGKILLNDIKILVLDEADRMLDMGFLPDIEKLMTLLPHHRQTLLFSATMPKEIQKLAKNILQNPLEVMISPPSTTAATVKQCAVDASDRNKPSVLLNILRQQNVTTAIIFCNRKREAGIVARALKKNGINAAELHGDLTQSKRTQTLDEFRKGDISILVASDVAARGLDIENLSHVINYDVPQSAEDYVHRIGRTGRAGIEGTAITVVTPSTSKSWDSVCKTLKNKVTKIKLQEEKKISNKELSTQKAKKTGSSASTQPVVGFGDHVPAFLQPEKLGKKRE